MEKIKLVFLDIDGVLNLIPQEFDKYGDIFHPHLVDNLRHIINSTNAKIVITSSWRSDGLMKMRSMWKYRNLPGEIFQITPSGYWMKQHIPEWKNYNETIPRGEEIKIWLELSPSLKNKIVTHYVILDDDIDMTKNQLKNHFVRTSENYSHSDCVDAGYGLTKICSELAIKILNK